MKNFYGKRFICEGNFDRRTVYQISKDGILTEEDPVEDDVHYSGCKALSIHGLERDAAMDMVLIEDESERAEYLERKCVPFRIGLNFAIKLKGEVGDYLVSMGPARLIEVEDL